MSLHVEESAVIVGSIDSVWELIRPLDFKFLPNVESVESSGASDKKEADNAVGGLRIVQYKDNIKQTYKVLELSDIHHTITYDLIESSPSVSFSSAVYTISLKRITESNSTFICWTTDFSNDAGQAEVQDSKFKKLEAFKLLRSFLSSIQAVRFRRQLSEPTRYPTPSTDKKSSSTMEEGDVDSRPSLD
mmetsp:Transcript_1382/g.2208  ORF Transcript_1382/g.2208 Transcript_1382/m.2208 type:complete len:189 (+) Transcript_1382:128-694(+)